MGDIILVEGNNEQNIVLEPIVVAPLSRIGKWSYSVTVSYPELHREYGDWPDHTLDFDFDLYPSSFVINVTCHNESAVPILGKLEIISTNATIFNQASEQNIPANRSRGFSFTMGLPREPGEYYFDAVLSFDGVIVDQGRWVIRYY